MIQRVQTLYLGIVVILLSVVTFGVDIVRFVGEKSTFVFNSYGIMEKANEGGDLVGKTSWPIYAGTIALILLAVACILSYKNLARQFRLGRIIFGIYFLMVISVILVSTLGYKWIEVPTQSREMGIGFMLFVAGFPFTFLANLGIKRDKKLLDSLDRLR